MTTTKKKLDEERADVKAWRAALADLNTLQRTIFDLETKLPRGFINEDGCPRRIAFDAAILVGDAWRKLIGLEKHVPYQWEKLEAYAPSERALDVRLDCQPERREAA